jgi:hypothetical protein
MHERGQSRDRVFHRRSCTLPQVERQQTLNEKAKMELLREYEILSSKADIYFAYQHIQVSDIKGTRSSSKCFKCFGLFPGIHEGPVYIAPACHAFSSGALHPQ